MKPDDSFNARETTGTPGADRGRAWAYGLAGAITLATIAVRFGLAHWFGSRPVLILFIFPILISAYVGGVGPGLLATTIAAAGTGYLLLPSASPFAKQVSLDLVQWLMLVLIGISISVLTETLRRRSQALRESEEIFSKAFRLSPDCMVIVRLSDRTVVHANEALCRLWNVLAAEIIGTSSREYTSWVDEAEQQAFSRALEETDEVLDFEATLGLSNGRIVPMSLSSRRIIFGGELCVLSVMRDISERKRADAAAHLITAIVDSSDDAIIGMDVEGIVTSWNQGAGLMFGYTAEEMVGRSITRIIPADRQAVETHILGQIIAGKPVRHFETIRLKKDGQPVEISVTVSPIKDTNGRVLGASKIARDIGDRRRAEAAVREARDRFAKMFSASPVASSLSRMSDGRFQDVNEAYLTMFQRTRDEMIGHTALELGLWVDLAVREQLFAILEQHGVVHEFEMALRRKSGAVAHLRWSGVVVMIDGARYLLGSALDVTERKQAEAALRESEERMRSLVNLMPDALFINQDDRIVFINERGLKLWRATSPGQLLGRSPLGLFDPAEHAAIGQRIRRVLETGEVAPVWEARCVALDGTFVAVETAASLFTYGGRPALQVVVRDITERKRAEEALRITQFSMDRSGDAIFWLTPDGSFVRVNEATETLVGYSRAELLTMSAYDLNPSHPPAVWAEHWHDLREKSVLKFETEFRTRDGRMIPVGITANYIAFEGQEFNCAFIRDLTESKRAEEKLRWQEAVLRETGQIAKVGGWSFEVATGEGYWTEEVARIHDLDPGAPTNRDVGLRYYIGESRLRIQAAVAAAMQDGTPYDLELEIVSARGARKAVRTIGHPVLENGKVVRVRGSFQDITERRQAESRAMLRNAVSRVLADAATLADATPGIIRAIGEAEGWEFGTIWEVDAAAGLLRCREIWQREDLAGHELAERTRSLTFGPGRGLPGRVWASGELQTVPDLGKSGDYVRAPEAQAAGLRGALAFPIFVGSEVTGVIDFAARELKPPDGALREMFTAIGRQVGLFIERRRAEEQVRRLNAELEQRVARRTAQLEAANKELEAFTYSVSHDLRTPLRAVDGFSQAVLEDYGASVPAEGLRYLHTIRNSAQRMGKLIDDLLAFSRLSRHSLHRQSVDTELIVRSALADLQPQLSGRDLVVEIGPLAASDGDPALLKQVWINLLANAVKYTGRRAAAKIEVGCREQDGRRVFFVRDNGCGFDMQYAHKLFGVFQRMHKLEEYEGTGVGLAIVQRIVERHHGRVWAEAAVNEGATFSFTLNEGTP